MDFFTRTKSAKKGDFGKVAIIGGSEFCHGAPILAGLGALAGGADLVTIFLPKKHAIVARNKNTNFFVQEFSGDTFSEIDAKNSAKFCEKWADVVVIGNGFFGKKSPFSCHSSSTGINSSFSGCDPDQVGMTFFEISAVQIFLQNFSGKIVLDGGALYPEILPILKNRKNVILTPHSGEFQRLFGNKKIEKIALEFDFTILKKGEVDTVACGKDIFKNSHGVPEMAVGGTGDALVGICGAFFARSDSAFEAAKNAIERFTLAGEKAAKKFYILSAEKILDVFIRKD